MFPNVFSTLKLLVMGSVTYTTAVLIYSCKILRLGFLNYIYIRNAYDLELNSLF